ncbi:hypothetical protein [Cryobacterium zhongshanensis]|uniref:FHA domain-containing protein n=1 Tax=Cryobacterium zhongshanensis TaxID=2928153 RepID=A0AA41UF55_9MICO|nr:hypothetical protein [Cryobacterium zhongshanensis]MCI4658193.1 hypothetical protein [Cryobacterium zhongshanensis]
MTGIAVVEPAPESALSVEYCGEWYRLEPQRVFAIGRDADLDVDDNPFLHRRFLEISRQDGLWWLSNVGSRLAATVTDGGGRVQAWLAPGARLPIVFGRLNVIFTAGPTTYEFTVHSSEPPFAENSAVDSAEGITTIGTVSFTPSQKLLILALAEPMLLREGTGMSDIPTSVNAAKRLGWATTRFNRKLDNVCDKLDRVGVQGLRGGVRSYATNRRARLVEYALAARIATRFDLPLLDQPQEPE